MSKTEGKKHYLFLRKIAPTGGWGGLEKLLLNWFREIDYRKFKISLAVTQGKEEIFLKKINRFNLPVKIFKYSVRVKGNFFKKFLNMFNFLKRVKPDCIVYLQGGFDDFDLAEVFAGYIYTKANIYMSEHSETPPMPAKRSRLHFGFILGLGIWWYKHQWRGVLSKKILAVSNEVKERLVNWYGYPEKRIVVRYHGVDREEFFPDSEERKIMREKFNISESEIVVISVARLAKEKCIDRLINAFDEIYKNFKNLWLFIVGDGYLYDDLKSLANQKRSGEKIKFLGFQENVARFLKMSDIFVLPSDNEGLSIALMEAMATGLIVVATKTPGSAEIIKDGVNGFLVERSKEGIIKGLTKALLLTQDERERISANAVKLAGEKFDIRKNIKEELSVFGLDGRK